MAFTIYKYHIGQYLLLLFFYRFKYIEYLIVHANFFSFLFLI